LAASGESFLSDLLLTNLDEKILARLDAAAVAHGSTAEDVAKEILSTALGSRPSDNWAAVDAIRQRLAASRRSFSDSLELLREDRQR
jgi:plasmid stability protein